MIPKAVNDRAFLALLRVLPKASLSTLVGAATRLPAPARLHQTWMRLFCRTYGVDLSEAERPLAGYATFGEFFSRRLRPGARPVASGETVPVSPVDGTVSEVGAIAEGRLLQAKGRTFSVRELLADAARAEAFNGGTFVTLYLAPRDYHRIHAPLPGSITGYAYVPGAFWPVNPISVRQVPDLFAVNERLITFLDTPLGQVAVVAVGATCVGRIRTAYDEVITHRGEPARRKAYPQPLPVEKGDELAVFEMGSTVIVLFQPRRVRLDPGLAAGATVRMGQAIGAPWADGA